MPSPDCIFIVEDEFLIAADIEAELESRGWSVAGVAARAEEAQERLAQAPCGIVLLDVNLGDHTSFDLARHLVSRGVQVLFLSGANGEFRPTDLSHLPFQSKPVAFDALDAALRALQADRAVAAQP
jgi:DNA-binding response OmpR family regulator